MASLVSLVGFSTISSTPYHPLSLWYLSDAVRELQIANDDANRAIEPDIDEPDLSDDDISKKLGWVAWKELYGSHQRMQQRLRVS